MVYIDYGTSLLTKKALELVPKNTFFSTGEFFTKLIENNDLLAFEVNKRFYHIGNPHALEEFREFIKTQ
jgi:NDP-sugar pyrophosphorylase family protein